VVKICEVGGKRRREKIVFQLGEIAAPISIGELGICLEQGKSLMVAVQRAIVTIQSKALADHAKQEVRSELGVSLKDYRRRRIQTPYGLAELHVPRLERHGVVSPITNWPSNCRSIPEFDSIRAAMSAWMSYRATEKILCGLLPMDSGRHHTTLRNQVLELGKAAEVSDEAATPLAVAKKMNLGLDCTFIRSNEPDLGRLHEVLFGHIEQPHAMSRVFASIGETPELRATRIGENLSRAGMTKSTAVTTFTDGGVGLRQLAKASGLSTMPILDWHHVAQRLQHVRQAAKGLKSTVPDLPHVTVQIIAEVERLRWRLWNGKPGAVAEAIEKIRPLVRTKRQTSKARRPVRPWAALMSTLFALRKYTTGQEAWMIDYARRHRRGERVGTSQTESAANTLVNKRMNKSQQMRWSVAGARSLLNVRAAVINGDLAPFAISA
jgi:hypothetical protein